MSKENVVFGTAADNQILYAGYQGWCVFFRSFGVNPLFIYVFAEIMGIPVLPVRGFFVVSFFIRGSIKTDSSSISSHSF